MRRVGASSIFGGSMGYGSSIVDTLEPDQIALAIKAVNMDPKLRSGYGIRALWKLYNAPEHTMLRAELDENQALDLHFGWFCRRVAEELGIIDPEPLALVNYIDNGDGHQLLALKPSVVAAMTPRKNKLQTN